MYISDPAIKEAILSSDNHLDIVRVDSEGVTVPLQFQYGYAGGLSIEDLSADNWEIYGDNEYTKEKATAAIKYLSNCCYHSSCTHCLLKKLGVIKENSSEELSTTEENNQCPIEKLCHYF